MGKQEKHYISIKGQMTEVSEEIYNAHSQMKRRERYEHKRDSDNGLFSYNNLDCDDYTGESTIDDSCVLSLEEALLTQQST